MKESVLSRQSPFVYFWLGILTGALIVVGSLMIRSMADDGSTSVLRSFLNPRTQVQQQGIINPDMKTGIINPDMKTGIINPDMKTGKSGIINPDMKTGIINPDMKTR